MGEPLKRIMKGFANETTKQARGCVMSRRHLIALRLNIGGWCDPFSRTQFHLTPSHQDAEAKKNQSWIGLIDSCRPGIFEIRSRVLSCDDEPATGRPPAFRGKPRGEFPEGLSSQQGGHSPFGCGRFGRAPAPPPPPPPGPPKPRRNWATSNSFPLSLAKVSS